MKQRWEREGGREGGKPLSSASGKGFFTIGSAVALDNGEPDCSIPRLPKNTKRRRIEHNAIWEMRFKQIAFSILPSLPPSRSLPQVNGGSVSAYARRIERRRRRGFQ